MRVTDNLLTLPIAALAEVVYQRYCANPWFELHYPEVDGDWQHNYVASAVSAVDEVRWHIACSQWPPLARRLADEIFGYCNDDGVIQDPAGLHQRIVTTFHAFKDYGNQRVGTDAVIQCLQVLQQCFCLPVESIDAYVRWQALRLGVIASVEDALPPMATLQRLVATPHALAMHPANALLEESATIYPECHANTQNQTIGDADHGFPRITLREQLDIPRIGKRTQLRVNMWYREATQFIASLENRRAYLHNTVQQIMHIHKPFFDDGQSLKPMSMSQAARNLGIHHSTLSRVMQNKWVVIDNCLYPLRFFFSEKSSSTTPTTAASGQAVKQRIRKFIAAEASDDPLSDAQLVHVLAQGGITIAQRTVAKYRHELAIPNKSQRRMSSVL